MLMFGMISYGQRTYSVFQTFSICEFCFLTQDIAHFKTLDFSDSVESCLLPVMSVCLNSSAVAHLLVSYRQRKEAQSSL